MQPMGAVSCHRGTRVPGEREILTRLVAIYKEKSLERETRDPRLDG